MPVVFFDSFFYHVIHIFLCAISSRFTHTDMFETLLVKSSDVSFIVFPICGRGDTNVIGYSDLFGSNIVIDYSRRLVLVSESGLSHASS